MTKEAMQQALDFLMTRRMGAEAVIEALNEALAQPPLPVQEPVAWDKPSASFDEWWDGDRRRDNGNPFTTDSFSYWAWEGWQAALAQRPWVGLTPEEILDLFDVNNVYGSKWVEFARTVEAKLKERNT